MQCMNIITATEVYIQMLKYTGSDFFTCVCLASVNALVHRHTLDSYTSACLVPAPLYWIALVQRIQTLYRYICRVFSGHQMSGVELSCMRVVPSWSSCGEG